MSENIFSNFYNKVISFFQKEKDENEESAKDTATNRLKLVLMQDRSNLDGATMQKMREQLISVISKYIEIDQEALDLNLESDGDEIALMLNIPVIRARTQEEIEELEKQEAESKANSQETAEEETEDEESETADAESEETESEEKEEESNEETSEENETEESTEDSEDENTDNASDSQEKTSSENVEQETKKIKKQKNK